MRTIVIGAFGNFGARICRALSDEPDIHLVATGRNPDVRRFSSRVEVAKLDLASPDFALHLARLSPQLVIHCAGPFQGQDYRVARASLTVGAHYFDLADGREFVANFSAELDAAAKEAGLLLISGASTVPALSSAVINQLRKRLPQIYGIRMAIAPGQRAPRGEATMAAVFSYAGKRFKWLQDGEWRDAYGWQEMNRMRFAGLGTRWAAACDIPDLALFPQRYPGVRTVEFRAALDLSVQHFALWMVAALRKAGVPLAIERAAGALNRVASLLNAFGTDRGGMLISLTGATADGTERRIEWHLTADSGHGPEIPCIAAILLTRKLARGKLAQRGAFPCMGFLDLAEFEAQFAHWKISTCVEEKSL